MSPLDDISAGGQAHRAQLEASDPHVSAFVSANAGSGKTKLLIDRLLRLMLACVDPGRIQCLTFTKAAAAEMAARLQRRLGEWVALDDDALDERLAALDVVPNSRVRGIARALFARVLDLPGGMRISTIHAFCQSLLRRFPLEASLSPHFALLEELEARAALIEAREAALREARADDVAVLAGLVTPEQLDKLLKSLKDRDEDLQPLLSLGQAARLARLRRAGGVAATSEAALLEAAAVWRDEPGDGEDAFRAVLHEFRDRGPDGAAKNALRLLDWLAMSPEARAVFWPTWLGAFVGKNGDEKTVGGFCRSKAFLTANPHLAQAWEDEQARVLRVEDGRRALRMAEATAALIAFAEPVLRHYADGKASRGLLEYDELIRRTTALLHDPGVDWVLYKLDGGLDHLLLDEVQDTAPAQWEIAGRLTEPFFQGLGGEQLGEGLPARSVFAVGDRKQSIFSFQGADPEAFDHWRTRFRKRLNDCGSRLREPSLAVSFRSVSPVLRLVDAVFESDTKDGVREGGAYNAHVPSREGMAGHVELWPLTPRPAKGEEAAPWGSPSQGERLVPAPQRLAATIAATIKRLLDEGDRLESRDRPVRAGDFLILVRRRTAFGRALVSALKRLDVPVAGLDRMVLTEQPAVADLLTLGDALLLPEDDLSVACVLTSPLGGLDDDSLMALAAERRGTLIEALRRRAGEREDWGKAWAFLSALRDRVDFATPHGLFVEALGPLGGRARLYARLGPEAGEPIDELLNLALAYARTRPASMQGFLHWLRQSGAEVKRESEGAGGAVRIMTVHSAKGLQAPIVIIPDTTGLPPREDGLVWTEDRAAGLTMPLWAPRKELRCAAIEAIEAASAKGRLGEYNRLLYVALTRAEDRLIVCGWQPHRDPDPACWYRAVERGMRRLGAEARSFGLWEGEALIAEVTQSAAPVPDNETSAAAMVETPPAWAGSAPGWHAEAPAPEPPRPLPLAPSQPDWAGAGAVPAASSPLPREARAAAFRRGSFVHMLLQHLPGLPPGEREAAVARAATLAPELDPQIAESLAREALAVIEDASLAALFGTGSRAEQALTGYVEGVVVTGQVDRLAVGADEVIVADYKTAREPPALEATPPLYLRQMAAYRAVLRGIYPERRVRCILIWTAGPVAVTLPDELLDRHAPRLWGEGGR